MYIVFTSELSATDAVPARWTERARCRTEAEAIRTAAFVSRNSTVARIVAERELAEFLRSHDEA